MAEAPSLETPPPPPAVVNHAPNHPVHHTLASAANLANLLPTGTVLAFQTLIPTFSSNGSCQPHNKFLTSTIITVCALLCFVSSFTDSFVNHVDGKLYYGIATFKGLYIFNYIPDENMIMDLRKYKIKWVDFVHSFMTLLVFFVFALSNHNVQSCFVSESNINFGKMTMNLPLGAGILSSFLFTIFPTTRRGIGYADVAHRTV